jgi:23S rRNA pseudouridine1911/1915/1917 synthase
MPETIVQFVIQPNPLPRLDKVLARDVPDDATLSRSRLGKLIADGAVQVDGAVVTDPRARVAEGAAIVITVQEAVESHIEAQDIALDIIYEDDDLIVLNKPSGMVVHPAPGTQDGTLVNALIHHCGDDLSGVGGMKRPGIRGWPRSSRPIRSSGAIWRCALACPTLMIRACAGLKGRVLSRGIS